MNRRGSKFAGARRCRTGVCLATVVILATAACAAGEELVPPPRADRWESTVKAFEKQDKADPLHRGEVLLVGGSNARRWTDVDAYFPRVRVSNRGFGGARLSEVLHFADRLIFPLEPAILVVNAGGNDLGAGASPEQVAKTAASLIATVRERLPDTRIIFIGLPYVARVRDNPQGKALVNRFNQQLADLAGEHAGVAFIDLVPAFLDASGKFRPDLFVADGIHFSASGYAIVAGLLASQLELERAS